MITRTRDGDGTALTDERLQACLAPQITPEITAELAEGAQLFVMGMIDVRTISGLDLPCDLSGLKREKTQGGRKPIKGAGHSC